ncbi:MAG TPA: recombinase family protein [Allosphingosinicella sp.]|nr:recombinase family protein [Allosphingosinicella sp.]
MTQEATIYARFSSLEQSRGSSLERQFAACAAMCERHGWRHNEQRRITDEGLSAFHGFNRAAGGGLHEFERKAVCGHFQQGHVLVCENLDRISRQGYEETLGFLRKLTQSGVTVATVEGDTIYPAHQRVPLESALGAIIKSELALQESQKKSARVKAAWESKWKRARAGDRRAITARCPSWLVVHPVSREYSLIPHRAKVLRDIFEWSAAGYGTNAIARKLNDRAEPLWGGGNGWQAARITQLLSNRAVLGEYQAYERIRKPARLTPIGERILDYYPAAITADLFNRSQAARSARQRTGGRRGKTNANLFSSVAKCASCGGRMTYNATRRAGDVVKGQSGSRKPLVYVVKTPNSTLACDNAKRRIRDTSGALLCDNTSKVRYQHLERALLDHLLHFALDPAYFQNEDAAAALAAKAAEIDRRIEGQCERLARLVDAYSRSGSEAVEAAMLKLEDEISEAKQELIKVQEQLARERGSLTPDQHLQRVSVAKAAIAHLDPAVRLDARVKVAAALKSIIRHMECDEERNTLVWLVGYDDPVAISSAGKVTYQEFAPNVFEVWAAR